MISSGESAETTAPRFAWMVINPSAAKWLSASRTGMRLIWNSLAIASCRSCSPSRSSPLRIFSRRRSTTAAERDCLGIGADLVVVAVAMEVRILTLVNHEPDYLSAQPHRVNQPSGYAFRGFEPATYRTEYKIRAPSIWQ